MKQFFKSKPANSAIVLTEGLSPCLPGEAIIKKECHESVKAIRQTISAPAELYQELYVPALYRVAELCQAMPTDKEAKSYSFLSRQLTLTAAALQLRQGLLLPCNGEAEVIAKEEPRWTYAIFSAGLLYQLANLQIDRSIKLYNAKSEYLYEWHLLQGSLYDEGRYYAINWEPGIEVEYSTVMGALAARLITPKIIQWLSQNKTLLKEWWEAITSLQADNIISETLQEAANHIGYSNSLVDKQPISFDYQTAAPQEAIAQEQTQIVTSHENVVPMNSQDMLLALLDFMAEQYLGDETTLDWLRVEEGLLVSRPVIENFITAYSDYWQTLDDVVSHIEDHLHIESHAVWIRYRPANYDDARSIEGIVIQEDSLNDTWKQQTIHTEFQPAITA